MNYQKYFKRYELKYLLTKQQKEVVLQAMSPYMALDQYGRTTIRNIYFDTDTYRLVRRSIERPTYKEKLRVRSYSEAGQYTPVFVELKKKYRSVVYKRRIALPRQQAFDWLTKDKPCPFFTQVAEEINYFCGYYRTLEPKILLSYEREAFYSRCGDDFRITFDDHILFRQEELSLETESWGYPLLDTETVLMEIKTPGGIPLWMSHFLSEQHLFKTSFSKYGTAYQTMIVSSKGGRCYA